MGPAQDRLAAAFSRAQERHSVARYALARAPCARPKQFETLQKAGKGLFFLTPVPELNRWVQQIIIANQSKTGEDVWSGATRGYYDERNKYILKKLQSLPWGNQLIRVAPASTLCNENVCRAVLDGEAAYFDDDHLSVAGARRVIEQMEHYIDD